MVTFTPERYLDTATAAASPLHRQAVRNVMRGRGQEGSQSGRGGLSPIPLVGGRLESGNLSPRVDGERAGDYSFANSEASDLAYTQGALEQAQGRVGDGGVHPIHPMEDDESIDNGGLPLIGSGRSLSRSLPEDLGRGPSDMEASQDGSSPSRASEVTRHLHELLDEVEEAHGHANTLDMTVEEELGRVNRLVASARDLQQRQDQQGADQVARWDAEWEGLGLPTHGSQGGSVLTEIQRQALATQREFVQTATDRGKVLYTELTSLSESAEQLIEQRRTLAATHNVLGQGCLDAKALLGRVESPKAENVLAGPSPSNGTRPRVTPHVDITSPLGGLVPLQPAALGSTVAASTGSPPRPNDSSQAGSHGVEDELQGKTFAWWIDLIHNTLMVCFTKSSWIRSSFPYSDVSNRRRELGSSRGFDVTTAKEILQNLQLPGVVLAQFLTMMGDLGELRATYHLPADVPPPSPAPVTTGNREAAAASSTGRRAANLPRPGPRNMMADPPLPAGHVVPAGLAAIKKYLRRTPTLDEVCAFYSHRATSTGGIKFKGFKNKLSPHQAVPFSLTAQHTKMMGVMPNVWYKEAPARQIPDQVYSIGSLQYVEDGVTDDSYSSCWSLYSVNTGRTELIRERGLSYRYPVNIHMPTDFQGSATPLKLGSHPHDWEALSPVTFSRQKDVRKRAELEEFARRAEAQRQEDLRRAKVESDRQLKREAEREQRALAEAESQKAELERVQAEAESRTKRAAAEAIQKKADAADRARRLLADVQKEAEEVQTRKTQAKQAKGHKETDHREQVAKQAATAQQERSSGKVKVTGGKVVASKLTIPPTVTTRTEQAKATGAQGSLQGEKVPEAIVGPGITLRKKGALKTKKTGDVRKEILLSASLAAMRSPQVPRPTRMVDTPATAGTGKAASSSSAPQATSTQGGVVGTGGKGQQHRVRRSSPPPASRPNPPQVRRTSPPPATRRPASRDRGETAGRANQDSNLQQDGRSAPPVAPAVPASAQTSQPPPQVVRLVPEPDDLEESMIEARGVFSAIPTDQHIVVVAGADGRDYFSTMEWYTKVGAQKAAILAGKFFPAMRPAGDSAVVPPVSVPNFGDVLAQERVAASGHTEAPVDSRSFRNRFDDETIDLERDMSRLPVDRETSSDSDSQGDDSDELADAIEEGRKSAMRLHVREGETAKALAGLMNLNPRKSRNAEKPVVDHKTMLLKATHRRSSAIYNPKGRMARPKDEDHDTTVNTVVHWPNDKNLETTMNTSVASNVAPKAGEVVVSFDVLSPTDLWEEIRLTPEHVECTPSGWDEFLSLVDQNGEHARAPWDAAGLSSRIGSEGTKAILKGLEYYAGEQDGGEEFSDYLAMLVHRGCSERWSTLQLGVVLRTMLKGKALALSNSIEPPVNRYNIFALMVTLFGFGRSLKKQVKVFKERFRAMKQEAHETLQQWGLRVLEAGNNAFLANKAKKVEETMDKFIEQMRDRELARTCASVRELGHIKTLTELIKHAQNVDSADGGQASRVPNYDLTLVNKLFSKDSQEGSEMATESDLERVVKQTDSRHQGKLRNGLKQLGIKAVNKYSDSNPSPDCKGNCFRCGRVGHRARYCSAPSKDGQVGYITASCYGTGSSSYTPCSCKCEKHIIYLTKAELLETASDLFRKLERDTRLKDVSLTYTETGTGATKARGNQSANRGRNQGARGGRGGSRGRGGSNSAGTTRQNQNTDQDNRKGNKAS